MIAGREQSVREAWWTLQPPTIRYPCDDVHVLPGFTGKDDVLCYCRLAGQQPGRGLLEEDGDKREPRIFLFERALMASRWLQLPLFLGLLVMLVLFELKYLEYLFDNFTALLDMSRDTIILVTLNIIDMVLIANLVVMVTVSGYEIFISRPHIKLRADLPNWVRQMTASQLKSRIATTILLISTIHLLHVYLDPAKMDQEEVQWLVVVQLLFILTAAAFVWFGVLDRKYGNARPPEEIE